MKHVVWKKDPLKTLAKMVERLKKNAGKRAMRQACKPIVAALRAVLPRRTGALKKSISSKVDTKKGGLTAYGVVGARSKYQRGPIRPVRYIGKLEFGTKRIPPRHYIRSVWERFRRTFFSTVAAIYKQEISEATK